MRGSTVIKGIGSRGLVGRHSRETGVSLGKGKKDFEMWSQIVSVFIPILDNSKLTIFFVFPEERQYFQSTIDL